MKRSEAPPAGWYPDPQGGVRLRWWDGTDWTERYRSRPGAGEMLALARRESEAGHRNIVPPPIPSSAATYDPERIVAQVRQAAREETYRAADIFSSRAEAVARGFQPLVTEYTSKLLRWFRIAAVAALVLAVAWFVFEFIVQASLFNWIGDRIDNLTN